MVSDANGSTPPDEAHTGHSGASDPHAGKAPAESLDAMVERHKREVEDLLDRLAGRAETEDGKGS